MSENFVAQSGLRLPLQTAKARISSGVASSPSGRFMAFIRHQFYLMGRSYPVFYIKYCAKVALRWLVIAFYTLIAVECCFWVWVVRLSPREFDQFTSCLDAGMVSSWQERFLYHLVCFWGSL